MKELNLGAAPRTGDRLPNFMRPDHAGEPVVFYDVYCGQPVVLAICLAPSDAAVAAALGELDQLAAATPLVMVARDPRGAAALRRSTGVEARFLADDGQLIRYLFDGDPPPDVPLAVIALDANAHLVQRWDHWPGAECVDQALAPRNPTGTGPVVARTAPVLIVPDVFEPEFCAHLIEVFQDDNEPSGVLKLVDGRMVYETDTETKIRHEHRIDDPALRQAVEARLARRLLGEIEWAFNYQVTRYEAFKIVSYDAAHGGHFRAHRDNNGEDTAHRRFALTLNLNSDQYTGGELRFPEYGPARYKPPTGGAVVFSCSLAHEALAVSQGVRYALVSFFYSAADQHQQVQYEDRIRPDR